MAYESRAYDNEHGDPVVVLVVTGTHDVSRLVHLFKNGQTRCEQIEVGDTILRQVRRHNGGRAALQLLAAHGGPDFLHDDGPREAEVRLLTYEAIAIAQGRRLQVRMSDGTEVFARLHTAEEWLPLQHAVADKYGAPRVDMARAVELTEPLPKGGE